MRLDPLIQGFAFALSTSTYIVEPFESGVAECNYALKTNWIACARALHCGSAAIMAVPVAFAYAQGRRQRRIRARTMPSPGMRPILSELR